MADKTIIALIGANGMLARMVRETAPAEVEIVPFDLPGFDMTDRGLVLRVLGELSPAVIVNCAAYTNVDGAESDYATASAVNGAAPGYLAEAALAAGAVLVHVSTDYVFDGTNSVPYIEEDPVKPSTAYGRSKLEGERAVAASGLERYFIVRTAWLYGPGGKNFVETIARVAGEREELRVVHDQVGSPTYTGDLARALFRLLETRKYGLYHFSNEGTCSWYEFACEIIAGLRERGGALKVQRVVPVTTEEYPLPAPRPKYSVLSKKKYSEATGETVPGWRESLSRYLDRRG